MRTFVLICLLGGFASILRGQEKPGETPRPVPPPGPLLEKAPDFAQWTVTSKTSVAPPATSDKNNAPGTPPPAAPAHGDNPKGEPANFQTVVVKTKPIRYEQTVTATGHKTISWFLPDLQIAMEAGGTPVVTFAGTRGAKDFGKADFPGFEWISARNYEGIQKVSGQDCLLFREPYKVNGKAVQSDAPAMSVACIASESRLPVALQLGDEVRAYTFGQAPTTPLTLPPDLEPLVTEWRNSIRQASHPVAKP